MVSILHSSYASLTITKRTIYANGADATGHAREWNEKIHWNNLCAARASARLLPVMNYYAPWMAYSMSLPSRNELALQREPGKTCPMLKMHCIQLGQWPITWVWSFTRSLFSLSVKNKRDRCDTYSYTKSFGTLTRIPPHLKWCQYNFKRLKIHFHRNHGGVQPLEFNLFDFFLDERGEQKNENAIFPMNS